MQKKTAILLGGTSPHVILAQKLKRRGYYVILVDYLDNPSARQYTDEHIKASTLDREVVLNIARDRSADLVISTCIDQANSVCCYVAEKLGLPHPYSYQTSLDVTDKGLMKGKMKDNGIPTSPFILSESTEDIDWSKINYPAVVKPVDCNSSKGVHRVDSDAETKRRITEALKLSRTHKAIVEGYNEGEEIQVDCIALDKDVKVVLTRQKMKVRTSDNEMVLQSKGSLVPAPLSDKQSDQVIAIAKKIARAFGLQNTPFFYQAIVTSDGIQVIEFAPRIGGGLSYYMIKEFTGFDVVEAAIDSFLGNKIIFTGEKPDKCYSTNLLYMKPGRFDHVEGLQELKNDGIVEEVFIMKPRGTEIDSDMRSSNRIAAFVLSGESYEDLLPKEEQALNRIEIWDDAGKPLLNREIYNFKQQ